MTSCATDDRDPDASAVVGRGGRARCSGEVAEQGTRRRLTARRIVLVGNDSVMWCSVVTIILWCLP